MGRILGLDYGRKRVGIAVTDTGQLIASGKETVRTHDIRSYLKEALNSGEVERVVVGYPMDMANQPSEAVHYINPFLRWFRVQFPGIPLVLFDERFTSRLAKDALIRAGIRKKARQDKFLVDKISAALILQSYLDSENNKKERIK